MKREVPIQAQSMFNQEAYLHTSAILMYMITHNIKKLKIEPTEEHIERYKNSYLYKEITEDLNAIIYTIEEEE